jgi:hypothetical protein
MSNIADDTKLKPEELVAEAKKRGIPLTKSSLATWRSRGGGPPFEKFGPYVIYAWGTSWAWVQSRLSPVVHSTSELPIKKAKPSEAPPRRRGRPPKKATS